MTAAAAPVSFAPETSAPTPAPHAPETLSLTVRRDEAARMVRGQVEQGVAIRRYRVRYIEDLETVRAKKAEWVQGYTELLKSIFTTGQIADECNDWAGRVYPEYADLTLFVEQFYQEMDHRIRRLRAVVKKLPSIAEPVRVIPRMEFPNGQGTGDGNGGSQPASSADGNGQTTSAGGTNGERSTASGDACAPAMGNPQGKAVLLAYLGTEASAEEVSDFLRDLGLDVALVAGPGTSASAECLRALEHQRDATFAILVLPAGAPADGAGVLFPLGYFVGRLGRPRVCALRPGDGAIGCDDWGIAHFPLDGGGGWQLQLARHLRRGGIDVDLNKLC